MQYKRVCLEAIGYALPDEIVTSDEIEARLEPLYTRLGLPAGRLELMTGIRERRFWPRGMLPGEASVRCAEALLAGTRIDRREIGALIHGSVCRDYLEPSTASGVHHRLGLVHDCHVYDVSNACLGILNGIVQIANLIELGQIRAGLVVGTESSRPLVETTIEHLNADLSLTRESVKPAMASLTIGSGSACVLLVDREISKTGNRLRACVARAHSAGHALCQSVHDDSIAGGMHPLMQTDAESLLHAGVEAASQAFPTFLEAVGWERDQIDKAFCHQVGSAHRKRMFAALGLDTSIDYSTVEWLGNTGSAALPMGAALGIERGHVQADDRVALLGIGSGINVLLIGVDWRTNLLATNSPAASTHSQDAASAALRVDGESPSRPSTKPRDTVRR